MLDYLLVMVAILVTVATIAATLLLIVATVKVFSIFFGGDE